MTTAERIQLVREFQRKHGYTSRDAPTEPSCNELCGQFGKLLEEVLELGHALGFNFVQKPIFEAVRPVDFVPAVDGFRDVEYMLHGLDLLLGTAAAADDTFVAVHLSNMSKTPAPDMLPIKGKHYMPPAIAKVLRMIFPKHKLLFR